MNFRLAFVSDGEAAKLGKPGEAAFDDPAMLSEMGAAFDTLSGDAMLDTTFAASPAAAGIVVALVRMELAGPLAWPSPLTLDRRNGIKQRLKHSTIVEVGAAETHRQGNAPPVSDDVALRAGAAAIRRVRPDDVAPFFAAMDALSMQARLQSR